MPPQKPITVNKLIMVEPETTVIAIKTDIELPKMKPIAMTLSGKRARVATKPPRNMPPALANIYEEYAVVVNAIGKSYSNCMAVGAKLCTPLKAKALKKKNPQHIHTIGNFR